MSRASSWFSRVSKWYVKIDLISYLVFSHTSPTLSSTKLPQWKHFERAWDLTNVSILGRYWIDPNEGCIDDAVQVYCDFEEQVNCIEPKNHKVGTLPILWTPLYCLVFLDYFHENVTTNSLYGRCRTRSNTFPSLGGVKELKLLFEMFAICVKCSVLSTLVFRFVNYHTPSLS